MRRQATMGALLLIIVGVVLGATVFRTNVAEATGVAKSVSKGGVTGGSQSWSIGCPQSFAIGSRATASGLTLHLSPSVVWFALKVAGSPLPAFSTYGPAQGGPADVNLSFSKPVSFDTVECIGSGGTSAGGTVGNGK